MMIIEDGFVEKMERSTDNARWNWTIMYAFVPEIAPVSTTTPNILTFIFWI